MRKVLTVLFVLLFASVIQAGQVVESDYTLPTGLTTTAAGSVDSSLVTDGVV